MTAGPAPVALRDDEGRQLPPLARAAVARALGVATAAPALTADASGWLAAPRATFVTLTLEGALRGCVGRLEATRSLLADLEANAVAAALQDPRFPPLGARELPGTRFAVSVLSPLEPLPPLDEPAARAALVPALHGVVLSWRERRATFLPQVWGTLPSPADFLAQLALKAGLPPGFWSPEVELATYTVESWEEESAPFEVGAAPAAPPAG